MCVSCSLSLLSFSHSMSIPASTNEEIAERVTEPGYVPTFDGEEGLPPSLVAFLGERRAERLLQSVAEDAVNAFAMPGMAKEFEGHRAVVQRVYGDERACATLKDFVRANMKVRYICPSSSYAILTSPRTGRTIRYLGTPAGRSPNVSPWLRQPSYGVLPSVSCTRSTPADF